MPWSHSLIKDTLRSPHEGIGKPEPLRQGLAGYWSRRSCFRLALGRRSTHSYFMEEDFDLTSELKKEVSAPPPPLPNCQWVVLYI